MHIIYVIHTCTILPQIITFDAHGVSGHINHIDTFRGVRQLLRRQHRQEAGGQESATQLRALAEAPAKATTSALLTSASHLEAYTLASVGLHRKYIGPFDIIVHYAYSLLTQPCSALKPSALSSSSSSTLDSLVSDSFCFVNVSHSFVCRLMQAHRSQFVWFRWLFVLFSRYVVFNELTPMQVIEEKEEKWYDSSVSR